MPLPSWLEQNRTPGEEAPVLAIGLYRGTELEVGKTLRDLSDEQLRQHLSYVALCRSEMLRKIEVIRAEQVRRGEAKLDGMRKELRTLRGGG